MRNAQVFAEPPRGCMLRDRAAGDPLQPVDQILQAEFSMTCVFDASVSGWIVFEQVIHDNLNGRLVAEC